MTLLAGLVIAGCQDSSPPEPVRTVSKYAQQFIDSEDVLSAGGAIGVLYVHPMRKRACNTMQVRVSVKNYNGMEYNWEVAKLLEIQEENSAPAARRNIGEHPVLFDMEGDNTYRIDAISCAAFDKTVTTQFRNFAEFTVQAGDVAYIGDFTQARLAEGVDIYIPGDKFDEAKEKIGLDNAVLQSKLSKMEVAFFEFENFNGKTATSQDILDNVGESGDYFTLSQSLKTQADASLLPFLGYLPDFDVPPVTRQNVGRQKEELQNTMLSNFDLAMLRIDMKSEFEAIIEKKGYFKTARNYVNHRLAVVNTGRNVNSSNGPIVLTSSPAYRRHKIAIEDRDAFIKANGIKKIVDPLTTKEQKEARKNWKEQIERTAYVLNATFTGSSDVLLRDRVQSIMQDYSPAKYASLEIELTQIAERQNKSIVEIRRLRRLLESAKANEELLLKELISNFMQENLAENETYHAARESFSKNWLDIFVIIDVVQ